MTGPLRPCFRRIRRRLVLVLASMAVAAPGAALVTPCVGGFASVYPCSNVDLLAHLPLSAFGGGFGNDLWGWTDSLTQNEYAILGLSQGVAFVDITDPENPVHLGLLPSVPGGSFWSDIKIHADHAYIVSEAATFDLAIFDLTQLRSVTSPPVSFSRTATYSGIDTAHNIAIDEDTGFAYVVGSDTCSGGLHILDLSNPVTPVQVGCYTSDFYTHDAQCVTYQGPDTAHVGKEVCFNSDPDFNALGIVDVTSKTTPVRLSRTTYAGSSYAHQGWLTEDHAWFLMSDEDDEISFGHGTRTYVWDVSDLDAPVLVGHRTAPELSTDHNLYVVGDHVYATNYTAGLRILRTGDLSQAELGEVAWFDTFPPNDFTGTGVGAWSNYPFFPSGTVAVSDIASGLFLLRPDLDAVTRCDDGLDNDADGLVDYGAGPGNDPGCGHKLPFAKEDPQCLDGVDNDFDGDVDFPEDSKCRSPFDDDEATNPGCGIGFELAPLLALLAALRRRR